MSQAPETRPSLLLRIRDAGDAPAWGQFAEVYAPLIHGFLRKKGLQDADAADVTQEVLHGLAQAIRRFDYDARRGSFRGWLFTIVRHELCDFLARQQRGERASGDSVAWRVLQNEPARDAGDEAAWQRDYQERVFRWAARRVRRLVTAKTWDAFWRTSVAGESGQEVARSLGMNVAAVYVARSRVLTRLRDVIQQLEGTEPPASEEHHV